MNELKNFNNPKFGEIRIIKIDGKTYFVAKDVAIVLGYKDTTNAVKQHCKGVVKCHFPTKGGKQIINVIPEGDVYRLVVHSALPTAEKFEQWVFDEVLPTIRRDGKYMELDVNEDVKQTIYRANVPGSEAIQRKMECIRRHMSALDIFLDTYNKRNSLERQEQLKGGAIALCFELAFHVVELTKVPYETCVIESEAANKSIICKTTYGSVDISSEIN